MTYTFWRRWLPFKGRDLIEDLYVARIVPQANEDWDQYEVRRGAIILGRSLGDTVQQEPSESNAHQKAGCYDCDLLWNGETACRDAIEHGQAVCHSVWRIYAPD